MPDLRPLAPPTLLFLDCETSGLYQARLSIDDPQQPWCPEIAAVMCTEDGHITNHFSLIINNPNKRPIKENALAVHGINQRASAITGVPEPRALGLLTDMLKTAPLDSYIKVITFSDFDRMVLASLFARLAISQNKPSNAYDRLWLSRPLIKFIDLQKPYCQMACRLKSDFDDGSFRWPSLDEARQIILGLPPRNGLHAAFEDVMSTKAIYFKLKEQGVMDV